MQDITTILETALRAGLHQNVGIYTGVIPDKVPTYSDGSIKPYVGLWVSLPVGFRTMETISGGADSQGSQVTVQTQIVAANHRDVMTVAGQVRAALTNLEVNGQPLKPEYEQQASAQVLTDPNPTPRARFLPLIWELKQQEGS